MKFKFLLPLFLVTVFFEQDQLKWLDLNLTIMSPYPVHFITLKPTTGNGVYGCETRQL
jgi:hypothetical protein